MIISEKTLDIKNHQFRISFQQVVISTGLHELQTPVGGQKSGTIALFKNFPTAWVFPNVGHLSLRVFLNVILSWFYSFNTTHQRNWFSFQPAGLWPLCLTKSGTRNIGAIIQHRVDNIITWTHASISDASLVNSVTYQLSMTRRWVDSSNLAQENNDTYDMSS